jgi:cytochrome b involved in lipid metabolism
MISQTTLVRKNKEKSLLIIFNNVSYLILNFKSNHKFIDGRELKKVSLITTSMKDKIMKYEQEAENSSTSLNDEYYGDRTKKSIKKSNLT